MLQPALAVAMAAMVFWIALATPGSEPTLNQRLTETRPEQPSRSILTPPDELVESRHTLGPGSVVAARSQTRELVAFERHVMELSPRTRVTIVAWNPRRIVLNVTSGSVRAVVKRERDGDHFELRTAHVRARALGTDYRVSVRQQGVTTVRVAHGAVEVKDKASGVTTVAAGETLRVGARGPIDVKEAQGKPTVHPPAATELAPSTAKRRDVVEPKASSSGRPAPRPSGDGEAAPKSHGLKVIEIDVAPQAADRPEGG